MFVEGVVSRGTIPLIHIVSARFCFGYRSRTRSFVPAKKENEKEKEKGKREKKTRTVI